MNILVVGRVRPLVTKWFDRLSESDTKLATYVSPSIEFAELVLKYISRCSAIVITLELNENDLESLVSRLNAATGSVGSIRIGVCRNDTEIVLWDDGIWRTVDCSENVNMIGISLGLECGASTLDMKRSNVAISNKLLNEIDFNKPFEQPAERYLTPRQREVLKLVNMGKSNKEIARELVVSEGTVKVHCKAIFRALGVSNRTQAAVLMTSGGHT